MIAGVNPQHVDTVMKMVTDEIRKFVSEPVTEEELSDSKSYYLGRMPLLLESNSGVAISLLNMEHFKLGLDFLQTYPQKIQAITAEAILLTTRKYLNPDQLAVAIAGP